MVRRKYHKCSKASISYRNNWKATGQWLSCEISLTHPQCKVGRLEPPVVVGYKGYFLYYPAILYRISLLLIPRSADYIQPIFHSTLMAITDNLLHQYTAGQIEISSTP